MMAKPLFTPKQIQAAAKATQIHAERMLAIRDAAFRANAQIGSLRNDFLNAIRDSR